MKANKIYHNLSQLSSFRKEEYPQGEVVGKLLATLFLSLCLSLTSCSDSDDNTVATESILRITSVQTNTGTNAGTDASATRATAGYTAISTPPGARIGIFRLTATGYSSNISNSSYTCTGTSWTTDNDIYLNGQSANVCAYYHYHSETEYSNPASIPLASARYHTDISEDQAKDICYATSQSMNATSAPWNIKMEHACAQLVLKITKQKGYSRKFSLAKVTLGSIVTKATINITTGNVTNSTPTADYSYEPTATTGKVVPIPEEGSGDPCTTAALLIPYTVDATNGLTVTLYIKEEGATAAKDVSCYVEGLKGVELKAGVRYAVDLKLGVTGLQTKAILLEDLEAKNSETITKDPTFD